MNLLRAAPKLGVPSTGVYRVLWGYTGVCWRFKLIRAPERLWECAAAARMISLGV